MSNTARIAATAANTLTTPLNIEDVFSTYVYTSNGSGRSISNNINLADEGGLVWSKIRAGTTGSHALIDTERGVLKTLNSNTTLAETTESGSVTAFNSDGYTIGTNGLVNYSSGYDYASWTFRKAPKFFDVVTYTGNGSSNTISHNLGTTPAVIILKPTSQTGLWLVWNHNFPDNYMVLNATYANQPSGRTIFTSENASSFTLSSNANANASGVNYVAYLFAHNDGDGDFGPTADQDIIKCGSYTGNGSKNTIDLGFEPQFVIIKRSDATNDWVIVDNMRGMPVGVADGAQYLVANDTDAEATYAASTKGPYPTSTGFEIDGGFNKLNYNNATYIYIAIRRGPMAVPESGTDVFAIDTYGDGVSAPRFKSGFPVDMFFYKTTTGGNNYLADRLRGVKLLKTDSTAAETTSDPTFDYMNGVIDGSGVVANIYAWMWRRAPNYFDVVAYTGNGTAGRTVSHNLGVAPEMIWVKNRIDAVDWWVYHKDTGATKRLYLNQSYAALANSTAWNDTAPTDSVFTVGTSSQTNGSGDGMIAYLFASVDGVSKVGSYTGNGTSQNIDCGFSSGARFVLIKRTDSTGDWEVYDTARGINAGNDSHLQLNTTTAQFLSADTIDPYSAGFTVNVDGSDIRSNTSGASYIFYAIA